MGHPNWMQSPPNYQDFSLGSLTALTEEHTRQITEQRADHRALKLEVDKLKTWAERAGILALVYILGTGLHLSAGTLGPVIGAAIRAATGLR